MVTMRLRFIKIADKLMQITVYLFNDNFYRKYLLHIFDLTKIIYDDMRDMTACFFVKFCSIMITYEDKHINT
jgi:hypothetical protein